MTLDITKCHGGGLEVTTVCPAGGGICQHHDAAYAELTATALDSYPDVKYNNVANGATIVQVQITTTKTCCIVVNAAMIIDSSTLETNFEIERPNGTIRTQQEDKLTSVNIALSHHAAWEVLSAGTYTYYLVNRAGVSRGIYGAWIKAVASDCDG
jgi:hypothetical protein